ncbi:hypothetical protein ACH5RR_041468 [Cinchona calisaya]|uniref:Phytocyanin domain-containing protein n=1 Tax=Cinchona calisaya TaxID=153742 RepID=A0ABD2XVG9_9GENT
MAFMHVIIALAIVAAVTTSTVAKDNRGWKLNFDYQTWAQEREFNVGGKHNIVVGDENGWKPNFDYQACAQGKEFNVRDSLIAFVATIVAPTMAKEFVVGDKNGWKLGVNYQEWAAGKEFYVGDTLVFNYKVGAHNVIKVNGTEFQQCAKPLKTPPLTTGHDVITLAAPGKKWYICGIGNHCKTGPMKLVINVLGSSETPSPAPAPTPALTPAPVPSKPGSGTTGVSPSRFFSLMVAALAIFLMIMA